MSTQSTMETKTEHEHHSVAVPSPDSISMFRELLFVGLMAITQIFTQAGTSQTINPVTQIGETFGVADQAGQLSWFSASYSLTVGTFILIAGRLGDMYGYKKLYISGFLFLGLWSLIAGFSAYSKSTVFFNICRALQGVGPAIAMPNATALMGHYFPNSKKKPVYMAFFGAVAPMGFTIGAIFSGLFAHAVWWPWGFWVMAMCCAAFSLLAYFIIPSGIENDDVGHFDWPGSITGVLGLILINFAWNQGPNVGWDKPYVYVMLILGILSMVAFVYCETKVADPLIPFTIVRGETAFVLGCIAAGWSCFGIWLYYSFRWLEYVDERSPVMRGVIMIPTIFVGFLAAALTVYLLRRTSLAVVMFLALLCFFAGIVLMGTRPVGQIYWAQYFVSIIVQSFGMDMSFPAGVVILSQTFPQKQQGLAGLLVSTFVNYSLSVGLGIAGTVEYYTIQGLPDTLNTKIKGMRNAFRMGMGLAGLGVVLSTVFLIVHHLKQRAASRMTVNEKEQASEIEEIEA